MKFYIFLFIVFSFLSSKSQNVCKQEATDYGVKYLQERNNNITNLRDIWESDSKNFYVLNVNPQGWIIISHTKKSQPVLAYSLIGHYKKNQTKSLHNIIVNNIDKELESIKQKIAIKGGTNEIQNQLILIKLNPLPNVHGINKAWNIFSQKTLPMQDVLPQLWLKLCML